MNQKINSTIVRQGDGLPTVVRQVTQKDINLYAEASGDFNPIHIDEAFASQTPLGGTIAHGMLILAYVSEMMTGAFGKKWLSAGKLAVRFKMPARPKDTITISGKVESVQAKENSSLVTCSVEVSNQRGETVISGEASVQL